MLRYLVTLLSLLVLANASSELINIADSLLPEAQAACKNPCAAFKYACTLVDQYAKATSDNEKLAILCQAIPVIDMACSSTCYASCQSYICQSVCKYGKPLKPLIAKEACSPATTTAAPTCSNYRLEISTGVAVKNGDTVWITAEPDPKMPTLTAKCDSNGKTPTASWKLVVSPGEICYTLSKNKKQICTPKNLEGTGAEWTVDWGSILQGGEGLLSWTDQDGKMSGEIAFHIRGQHPSCQAVFAEIDRQMGDIWYAKHIAQTESGFRQFKSGCPLPNTQRDGGYGLYQVTDVATLTCDAQWSWKVNIDKGKKIILSKIDRAKNHTNENRKKSNYTPVPREETGHCTFEDNTDRDITDAVALKQYNGASCPEGRKEPNNVCNYVWWNGSAWDFERKNKNGLNYVEKICNIFEPSCNPVEF